MTRMTAADFEARYRSDPDPWSYTTSSYERDKYAATLAACGTGPFAAALELGASIGVFSELLAPRCRSLVTVDAAESAVAQARSRLAGHSSVSVILGTLPGAVGAGDYDLVVASEILYYLDESELTETLTALERATSPGARFVAVHWRPDGPERPFGAAEVHARLRELPWLVPVSAAPTPDYLLDVLERR